MSDDEVDERSGDPGRSGAPDQERHFPHLSRAVLTLAIGKPLYVRMAANLARSFFYWHPQSDIRFVIATDQPDAVPRDLARAEIVRLTPGELGQGFAPKLHLDRLAPAHRTLFLDADCLCAGRLEPVFERFAGHAMAVVGRPISTGEFFGLVSDVCRRFDLPAIPWFVGGAYYLERGARSSAVYATARALEPHYDSIGLRRLRGVPNEEPLLAIAMALHGQEPLPDDGSVKGEPMNYPSGVSVDVLRGRVSLWNRPSDPRYNREVGLVEAHPVIVHFHGEWIHRDPYRREVARLERVMAARWPRAAASTYALFVSTVPQWLVRTGKNLFRPLYRRLFGYRPIARSDREP